MITCTRRIQFCAGHRVMGHENKCAHMHGHNYVVFVTAMSGGLDDIGRVIDFSVIKEKVGGWIDEYWDHGFICDEDDKSTIKALALFAEVSGVNQKVFTMRQNPTAENMAAHLLHVVCPGLLGVGIGVAQVTKVVLWETENCSAEVTL